jgi:hypothetical protein
MTRTRSTVLAVALALFTAVPTIPAAAQNPKNDGVGLNVPFSVKTVAGETVAGTMLIKEFVRNGDGIDAVGTFNATVTDVTGATRSFVTRVAWPVDLENSGAPAETAPSAFIEAQAVCDVLNLVLGPLHLDLLGLVVDLNQVVLDITAVSGAGNLLGNLLCAVLGLLDGGGAVTQIVGLLNEILAVLG